MYNSLWVSLRDENGVTRCMNMYDIRGKEEPSPDCGLSWPYELSDVTLYLRVIQMYAILPILFTNWIVLATRGEGSSSCGKPSFGLERMHISCFNRIAL